MRRLALALMLAAAPAAAQEVVGRGVVEGRAVELLEDGTWRGAPAVSAGCFEVVAPIAFCGGPPEWRPSELPEDSGAEALWRAAEGRFGQIVQDATGARDGVSLDGLTRGAIENAADFSGVPPDEIAILAEVPAVVDGVVGRTVAYRAFLEDTPLVFQNTMVLLPSDHAQIVSFALGDALTPELAALHTRFVSLFRIDEAAR